MRSDPDKQHGWLELLAYTFAGCVIVWIAALLGGG